MSTFCLRWFLLCFCFPFYLDDPTCGGKVGAHVISTKDWMFIWPPPAKWSKSIGGKTVPSQKSAHSILLVKSLCSVLMSFVGICCLFTGMGGYVISNASRDRSQTSYPLGATSGGDHWSTYGFQVGATNPTGMLSCFMMCLGNKSRMLLLFSSNSVNKIFLIIGTNSITNNFEFVTISLVPRQAIRSSFLNVIAILNVNYMYFSF